MVQTWLSELNSGWPSSCGDPSPSPISTAPSPSSKAMSTIKVANTGLWSLVFSEVSASYATHCKPRLIYSTRSHLRECAPWARVVNVTIEIELVRGLEVQGWLYILCWHQVMPHAPKQLIIVDQTSCISCFSSLSTAFSCLSRVVHVTHEVTLSVYLLKVSRRGGGGGGGGELRTLRCFYHHCCCCCCCWVICPDSQQ